MILVTGGAGYIGSHLVRELGPERAVVVDDLSAGHSWALDPGVLRQASILDGVALRRIFEENPIRAVVHFAGRIEAGLSVIEPLTFYRVNLLGTLTLLEEMTRAGVRTLIFSSTAAVYGEPERTPIDEEHPLRPTNPYGDTKLAAERLIAAWADAHGGCYAALRYFNAAGAHSSGTIGEDHRPETHLIPKVLDVAAGRAANVLVFGDDYETRDGTCIRDYVHVMDLAAAHVLALEHLERGGASGAFNLGSGHGFTVLEVIRTVEAVTGRPVPFEVAPRRPGDAAVLVASSDKAKEVLGWRPRWPDIESIVESAWRWHKSRGPRQEPA
jgi:UDP-glucose-4-epimerase GalE